MKEQAAQEYKRYLTSISHDFQKITKGQMTKNEFINLAEEAWVEAQELVLAPYEEYVTEYREMFKARVEQIGGKMDGESEWRQLFEAAKRSEVTYEQIDLVKTKLLMAEYSAFVHWHDNLSSHEKIKYRDKWVFFIGGKPSEMFDTRADAERAAFFCYTPAAFVGQIDHPAPLPSRPVLEDSYYLPNYPKLR